MFATRVAELPTPADASDRDRQQTRDCRLAAVRALGNFDGSREVGEAMVRLLQSEKDVAVRDRAKIWGPVLDPHAVWLLTAKRLREQHRGQPWAPGLA